MEGSEGLAYDDLRSDSDAMVMGVGACIITSHPESYNPTYAGVTNGLIATNGGGNCRGSACE